MNPELQKQIFSLETKSNLILTIGILLGLAWFIDRHLFSLGLETLSLFSFAMFCTISGSRKIIRALYSEVKSNVWNAQRFSQLSPLTLLVGKLLGPVLHCWVVGSVCSLFVAQALINLFLEELQLETKALHTTIFKELELRSATWGESNHEARGCDASSRAM